MMNTSDMYSIGDINRILKMNFNKHFVANDLQIHPDLETHLTFYWKKSKLAAIKLAIISHLVDSLLDDSNYDFRGF